MTRTEPERVCYPGSACSSVLKYFAETSFNHTEQENAPLNHLFKSDALCATLPQSQAMAKFIFSLGEENFRLLVTEAKTRDITIQELIRAVIIPDWVKRNTDTHAPREPSSVLSHTAGILNQRNGVIPSSIGRLKA